MSSVSKILARDISESVNFPHANTGIIGWWTDTQEPLTMDTLPYALRNLKQAIYIIEKDNTYCISQNGTVQLGSSKPSEDALPLIALAPPISLQQLGDANFCQDYNVRFPYMTGSMANGIASTKLVMAVARAGMLSSFGAAGLSPEQVEQAIQTLQSSLGSKPYCFNLIHSPNEKGKEDKLVDLYIKHGVGLVETSAYLTLTPAVVRYRLHGIHRDGTGHVVTPNRIIAKASRIEVATHWFSPPPQKILQKLLDNGDITQEQAELAALIPMAQDLTVEADSGGHTDNRPAITLLPTIIALRDRLQDKYAYPLRLRVGAAGGIATPISTAAAFAMGAAYVVSGTINQACAESGSSDIVRKLLAEAEQADVAMAPAVDMFEMGVKLQVLKRGTLFAMRGNKLYELYRSYGSIDEIPENERQTLEKNIFRAPLEEIWENTCTFFQHQDPTQISKAEQNPKHKMALMFRWYLGLSSRWANTGAADRQTDFQVWCGPAMGAFNEWSKGSFLQEAENRHVVTIALNLMLGAAVIARINTLRNQGIQLASHLTQFSPMQAAEIETCLE